MRDRTQEVVLRQTQAMETKVFEVGLFKPGAGAEMLIRTWDSETLIQSLPWLKHLYSAQWRAFPEPDDDLNSKSLDRMTHSGFTPALVVETCRWRIPQLP
jgi:hypothetical protein